MRNIKTDGLVIWVKEKVWMRVGEAEEWRDGGEGAERERMEWRKGERAAVVVVAVMVGAPAINI